jgi:hypothetical protein
MNTLIANPGTPQGESVRPPSTAVALLGTLCAVVALNGCSSSVQPNGKIAGGASVAGSGAVTSTPSNGVSSTSSTAPGNVLPADLTLDFTDPQLSGVSEAIYTSAKAFAEAYEAAASAGKNSDSALTSMTGVAAAAGVARNIDSDDHSGERWAGTVSFADFQVALLSKATGIGFCESDTEAYPVSISGDVRKGSSPTGTEAVRAWELTVAKQANGTYQVTTFSIFPGDSTCL